MFARQSDIVQRQAFMELDIYANVFFPLQREEPYLIVATAFPSDHPWGPSRPMATSATSPSLEQAQEKCVELARALAERLHRHGDSVRSVHVKEHR